MKNVLLFTLIILIGSISESYAQVYGFMGQRFSAEFNLGSSFSNAYEKANFQYRRNSTFKRVITIHPELTLNYAIGKRIDLGCNVGFQRFKSNITFIEKMAVPVNTLNYYDSQLTPSSLGDTAWFYPSDISNNTNAFNFDIYLRFYTKRHYAPVGLYHQLGFGFTLFGFTDKETEGYLSYSQSNATIFDEQLITAIQEDAYEFIKKQNNFILPRVSYRIGKKFMNRNGLYLNISAEVNWLFKRNITSKWLETNNTSYTEDLYQYHYQDAYNNSQFINSSQLFELKIGIGKTF